MLKYFSGLPLVGMLYRSISGVAVSFYKSSGIRIHPIPVKVGKQYFLTGSGGRAIRSPSRHNNSTSPHSRGSIFIPRHQVGKPRAGCIVIVGNDEHWPYITLWKLPLCDCACWQPFSANLHYCLFNPSKGASHPLTIATVDHLLQWDSYTCESL